MLLVVTAAIWKKMALNMAPHLGEVACHGRAAWIPLSNFWVGYAIGVLHDTVAPRRNAIVMPMECRMP
jgi:hypothetical protein